MPPLPLSQHARRLVAGLEAAARQTRPSGHPYHVASLGGSFYFAYEQLRNVAEYREHHLLLRSAIQRYLGRHMRMDTYEALGADLVTELTQSGYLKNDSVSLTVIDQIDGSLDSYAAIYRGLRSVRATDRDTTADWIFQTASVQVENLISPDPKGNLLMQFAFEHYYYALDRTAALGRHNVGDHKYNIALFCAVQRAIFKADIATTRYYCTSLSLPNLPAQPTAAIVNLNELIDELYQSPVTNRLYRVINRYGAPIRILRELVLEGISADSLSRRAETISRVKDLCQREYESTRKSLNGRIIKSILFILITKTLIGVAVEIPWDILVYGAVSVTPLIINIVFPLLYMVLIATRIHTPSRQNTDVIAGYIDRILYEGAGDPVKYRTKRRVASRSLNSVFNFVYAVGFIGSLALLVWILMSLGFNIVNGLIFFLFFSAVSFLGVRLRQSAHELQMVDEHEGVFSTLTDFLTTPFTRVGHWLSDTYSKANIITTILDLAIEMPIKTSLRLIRQWVGFMRDKQEEL
jgi:hypothetical protein